MDNLSLADTMPSLNYKYVRDSHISRNHPAADASTNTTFMRGQLETARKEQIRKMARILDEYKSPIELRGVRENLLPQAASSPKSDSGVHQAKRVVTPSVARSMSPTPTSQTMSWKKHSMRPASASPHPMRSSTQIDSATSLADQSKAGSNYQPPHLSQVEDSYWDKHAQSKFETEITPSPLRTQAFFTAKQFDQDASNMVEALKISSPKMQSPSVRQPASIASLSYDSRSVSYDPTRNTDLISFAHEPSFVPAQAAERRDSLDSELSKVDSQTTSLQRAISSALNEDPQEDTRQFSNLPVEDAIVARYRQSRNEKSFANSAAAIEDHIALKPKGSKDHVSEPLKQSSPLIGRNSQEWQQQGNLTDKGITTQLDVQEDSRVSSLLTTLEKVTDECSRRGKVIEAMVEHVESQPDRAVLDELHKAQQRAEALEQQMLSYQRQIDEMKLSILSMQYRPKVPSTIHQQAEESFHDKISRWDTSAPEEVIARAEAMLHQSVGSQSRASKEVERKEVRPLTAEMMPDAKDITLCPSQKLYQRLQLDQIDNLERNEMGNLLKNILIQLDTPYDQLHCTVIALGDQQDANEKVIHECIKLRNFAEKVHASLYGDSIEGAITSKRCLTEMHDRVDRLIAREIVD